MTMNSGESCSSASQMARRWTALVRCVRTGTPRSTRGGAQLVEPPLSRASLLVFKVQGRHAHCNPTVHGDHGPRVGLRSGMKQDNLTSVGAGEIRSGIDDGLREIGKVDGSDDGLHGSPLCTSTAPATLRPSPPWPDV